MALTLLGLLCLAPASANADSRYGCMAHDAALKLAIHVEFSEELGGRVSHLSGRLSLLAKEMPVAERERVLSSAMLSQSWADRDHVMLRLFVVNETDKPLSVALATSTTGRDRTLLRGHYRIALPDEKGPDFHVEGALFCQLNSETSAALAAPP